MDYLLLQESALAWRSYPVIPRVDSPDDDENFEAPVTPQVSPGRKHGSDATGQHNTDSPHRFKLHPRGILKTAPKDEQQSNHKLDAQQLSSG